MIKEYFDNLAEDWDKICVHDERKIEYILSLLNIKKHDTVLDCGCGTGILEKFLMNLSSDITAVDISTKMLKIAESKFKDSGIKF
ncbi:MAG: methyltransferase domain-containing protein, partial [Firmicutes bacterium]|nr:methyltransferase domain-containing protein [Bacillota bacterium]